MNKNYVKYGVKIRITKKYKDTLKELSKATGLKPKELFLRAVEEKYGVVLHDIANSDDKNEEDDDETVD